MDGIVRTNPDTSFWWRRRGMQGLGMLAWPLDAYNLEIGLFTLGTEEPPAMYEDEKLLLSLSGGILETSTPYPDRTRFLCFEDFLAHHGLSTRPLREVMSSEEALKADALLLTAAFIITSRPVANADTSAVAEVDAAAAALGGIILDLHMKVYGSFAQWY